MNRQNLALIALAALPLAFPLGCSNDTAGTGGSGGSGGSGGTGGSSADSYAANVCVAAKQAASSAFCGALFDAWAAWESDQDDGARDSAVGVAQIALDDAWDTAEVAAQAEDADCADLALTSTDAGSSMSEQISAIAGDVNGGLDLGDADHASCGAALLAAAGSACEAVLDAEGAHIADLSADTDGSTLEAAKAAAAAAFSSAWTDATSGTCPTTATESAVAEALENLTDALVRDTIVAPLVDDQMYITLEPGPTEYLGRTFTPVCMEGSDYRFFAKRGSVNKLLMYYQGGGACWNNFTCGGTDIGAVCKTNTANDDPNGFDSGFADLGNPDNPFRDWNIVFVPYCSCDVHFGDATQEYLGLPTVTVEHRGYHNSRVAEKWAREHFLNPEEVFVTGSSAGAYGAWFNAPLHHEIWPASQFHVVADAGNGVITTDFLENEFGNWNFVANLPDIPGVIDAITTGNGMPQYTEAVATFFPDTNWAHYSTLYDGGGGGQTGFFNIMLNDGLPLAAQTWWEASCQFGETALQQSLDTYDVVSSNYRYYFGTGSRHTMWGNDKVYSDTTGNVPTIVDWVEGMLASGPEGRDPAWENVVCEDCGLLLEGDPRPNPLQAPFETRNSDTVIVCE